MSFLKKLLGQPSEAQVLVQRAQQVAGVPLTPSHVGMFRVLKSASSSVDAGHYGQPPMGQTLHSLQVHASSLPELGPTSEMMGRLISFLGTMREISQFEVAQLAPAMGHTEQPTPLGRTTLALYSLAPYLGGADNPAVSDQVAKAKVADDQLNEKMLAWTALALARLDKRGGLIPPLNGLAGWDAF